MYIQVTCIILKRLLTAFSDVYLLSVCSDGIPRMYSTVLARSETQGDISMHLSGHVTSRRKNSRDLPTCYNGASARRVSLSRQILYTSR